MEKTADELLATEWWRAADADLLTALRDIEELQRRVHAAGLAILEEVRARNVTGSYDCTRAAHHDLARIPLTEAHRREVHLDLIQHSELTRSGVEAGQIGPDHLDVISKTLDAIPAEVDLELRVQAEEMLVEHAQTLDSRGLKRAAKQILAWLDQDGPEPVDETTHSVNELHISTQRDGNVRFTGRLGPEHGALLVGLLDPLAKPRPADGVRDWRGACERYGDAFADLLRLTANAAATPIDGGERPHLTVTISLDSLRDQVGTGDLGGLADLGTLTARQVRRIACDAKVLPMVLDADSQPLDVGRSKRTAPSGIRRGLVWRDGGCAFPTCDKPAPWTDAHHVKHWVDGGPTSLTNMVLLCRRHHTLIHQGEWEVRIRDRLPEFLPPAFIDPARKPRRNRLHGVPSPLRRHGCASLHRAG
ncbi:MAG TPA: DUF222 domain-containing protein [Pseudonocardiaceae bacterium]|nr:DUF222 domain-containing protein [Pseudonocardiaceae bacterium]